MVRTKINRTLPSLSLSIGDDGPYGEPNVTASSSVKKPMPEIECRYPDSVKRNVRMVITLAGLFFIWGWFFIDDPGWIGLGCIVMIALGVYYRTRINRTVLIDEWGIQEIGMLRNWRWPWKSLECITERCVTEQNRDIRGCRVVIEHKSGREIIIDHHMLEFKKAHDFVLKQARSTGIKPQRRFVTFFFIPYW